MYQWPCSISPVLELRRGQWPAGGNPVTNGALWPASLSISLTVSVLATPLLLLFIFRLLLLYPLLFHFSPTTHPSTLRLPAPLSFLSLTPSYSSAPSWHLLPRAPWQQYYSCLMAEITGLNLDNFVVYFSDKKKKKRLCWEKVCITWCDCVAVQSNHRREEDEGKNEKEKKKKK